MMHLRYASYVVRHKFYVFVECIKLGIIWRGLTHDLSKFLPDEWYPYAEKFYGRKLFSDSARHSREEDFDRAWLKHQHRNPHHWQYWRHREDDGSTKLIPMPAKYVKEMLADWRGAGKAQGFDSVGPWFKKNKDKIELADETADLLYSLMTCDERGDTNP